MTKRILNSISLNWNSYNQLEEQMNIEVTTRRVEFIGTLKDSITIINDEGEEEPYFSPKFLVVKYLKMSEADLELNDKYKLEEKLAKKAKEENGSEDEDTGGEDEMGGEDTGDEGGAEEEGGDAGNIDDEMMGDVQPESTETTQG